MIRVDFRVSRMFFLVYLSKDTIPETNISPENRPSQKEISVPTIHFQGRTVSFREGKTQNATKLIQSAHNRCDLPTVFTGESRKYGRCVRI